MHPDPDPTVTPKGRVLTTPIAGALLGATWIAGTFAAAGTAHWGTGWVYVTVVVVGLLAQRWFVARRAPELLTRRARIGAGTQAWDAVWLVVFWPLMLAAPITAAFATRLRHAQLPAWAVVLGGGLFAAGIGLSARAMVANPFFEGTARLQPDQHVVDVGPYRWLRHPGYAGLVLWSLSTPLLLRSALAFVPATACASWVVVRTVLEDRMLRDGLAGYDEYRRRVRWRLVPGVW